VPLDRAALFLDLDGTLTPIVERPDSVGPDAARDDLLRRADERLQGRLAVVSGRSIADLDRILCGAAPCLGGSHGLERRDAAGVATAAAAHPRLTEAVDAFRTLSAEDEALVLEVKPLSVALHYRGRPGAAETVLATARRLAHETGLALQEGRMVAELRTPGADKGDVLEAFMTEPPFTGALPIFVGDDLTDEPALAAAARLGGFGLLVGDREDTAATARLPDPAAVADWLERSLRTGMFRAENES